MRIKSRKAALSPILKLINLPNFQNGQYLKLQQPALEENSQSAVASLTTSLTAVAATWTNASDTTSTSSMISSSRTTPSLYHLVSFSYSTYIIDHLKSYSNLELNLYKNLFNKFYYPQLLSFLDNALSVQSHLYKLLDLVIVFALRFLWF